MAANRFRFWSVKSILVYNRYSSAVLTEVLRHLTMSFRNERNLFKQLLVDGRGIS